MRILIYADLNYVAFAGGIQSYLAALVKSLGELPDGEDEYLLLGPDSDNVDWLRPVLAANQKLVRHNPGWQPFLPRAAGVGARWLRRLLTRLLHSPRHRRILLAGLRRTAPTAGIQASNGYYESFGADVIHFPFQRFVSTRLPSVYNPHDLQHLHLPELWSPAVFAERELSYYYACRHATRVAVASNWIADDLKAQYGLPRTKIAVIPWGASTTTTRAPTAAEVGAARERYARNEPFVFYPALGWPHKNHERLFAAFAILRNTWGRQLRLVVTGGAPFMTDALHRSVSLHGIQDYVTVAGIIPTADMRPLYRGALAVVVPTLFEAVSGPVAEAWLEGTPATCSDLPQLREQADDAVLFFDPGAPVSIAGAIDRITTDEALRERLVAGGRLKLARLSWRETASRYRDLYREAAAASRRARLSLV